jgi:signal transduction histidine kinase
VAYDVVGDPERLTATTGLTVYRILQESLTNAVRHGSDGGAAVRLEVGDSAAVLTVDSPGAPGGAGPGAGLLGMQERAQALGGELTAGPAGDGWQVRTVLPA